MVQPSDIEAKAREIQAALDETKESAQNTAVMAGIAVAVVVLLGAYAWAVYTGHWTSEIPPAMLRRFHMIQFGG